MAKMENKEYLLREFEEAGIRLTEKQADQLLSYYDLLMKKNEVMNLTAITGFEEVVTRHFLDSVIPARELPMESVHTMIDVGSGAGFPGIPLKILYPEIEVVLLDSLNKRIQFLREVIDQLQLKQITAVHARAEDAAHNPLYREQFDLCVSRAVANLTTLSEYCLPFVRLFGSFAAYKSAQADEECDQAAAAVSLLGGGKTEIRKVMLPGNDEMIERSIAVIPKIKETPPKYPRKAGMPGKAPLLSRIS